jgi:diguanylate cyclase (GGDEF)-like protein
VKKCNTLRVRRVAFLSTAALAVFLSYAAVTAGVAPDARVGSVVIAAIAFPGLITGFVMVAYVAWETHNVREASLRAEELTTQLMRKEIELGRMSSVDELTRLSSRKEFDSSLRMEFERRLRYGRELSLLMLEVDLAGRLGDAGTVKTYLLTQVASIFHSILRVNDIGGRYNAERLALLLPETDDIRAQLVADKIRTAVAGHELLGLPGEGDRHVTVWIGIAVADDEFTSPGQFASAAETALGEAIAGGYNQVRVYSRSRSVDDDQHDGQYRLAS